MKTYKQFDMACVVLCGGLWGVFLTAGYLGSASVAIAALCALLVGAVVRFVVDARYYAMVEDKARRARRP